MRKALLASTCVGALSIWMALASTQTALAQEPGAQRQEQPGEHARHAQPGAAGTREGERAIGERREHATGGERRDGERATGGERREGERATGGERREGERAAAQPRLREERAATSERREDRQREFRRESRFDQRQISHLRERFRREGEASSFNFNARVGVAIPESVRLRELPPDIVAEFPEFRGYDFVMQNDQIVFVDPRSREVVEVIGGDEARPRWRFSREQFEAVRRNMNFDRRYDFDVRRAEHVPDTVVLEPVPETLVREVPDVGGYDYFVDQNGEIVFVDPRTRDVVDVMAADDAAAGAAVGGPVGAVVGGVIGAVAGAVTDVLGFDQRERFYEYVEREHLPSYSYDADVRVGAVLPREGVTYYEVPSEFGVRGYRYTIVNNEPVLVDPATNRIVQVIE